MSRVVLTDIEGTTSSIRFVKDVLFPYARRELPGFVRQRGNEPAVREWLDRAALDIGGVVSDACLAEVLQSWIDEDRKHTALKALQGMIWQAGYQGSDFRAHVYPDAVRQLRAWHAAGVPMYVYSSGSVPSQRLFFGHTDAGDLLPLFTGFFDTQVGAKREPSAYAAIVQRIGCHARDVLFLSDVVEELDAARTAGVDTVLVDRPDDYAEPRTGDAAHGHARVTSFEAIDIGARAADGSSGA